MNLQVLQESFSKALTVSSRFASTKAQLPVLSNILLATKKNKLIVSATNLELSISISLGAKVEKEGEITIPAKVISDLVNNLASGSLNLSSEKEQLKITSSNGSSTLSGMNSSDFPSIPHEIDKNVVTFSSEELIQSISQVLFAASSDETRPVLTGVLLIFNKDSLIMVATDGFRLSKKHVGIKINKKALTTQRLILPKNSLNEISRLTNEKDTVLMSLRETENQVLFGVDDSILSSRVIEGQFPDFEKIIPKDSNCKISIDKEELLRAVKLASVFARDAANVVKFSVGKDSIEVSAQSSQTGSQKAKVDAKVEGDSKSVKIAFNYRFLEDFLNSAGSDDIQIELGGANSPGVFTDPKNPDYLHLIMPVRIQD